MINSFLNKHAHYLSFLLSLFLLSCSSDLYKSFEQEKAAEKFQDAEIEAANFYPKDSDLLKDDLSQIIGSLLPIHVKGRDTTYSRGRQYVNDNAKPVVKIIDNDILYEAIIESKFQTNVNAMSAVTVNLGTEDKAKITYGIIGKVTLENKDIPWGKLDTLANQEFGKGVIDYFYVTSITLKKLTYNVYKKLGSDTKVQGTAFSVGNEVFYSNSKQSVKYEVILSGTMLSVLKKEVKSKIAEKVKDKDPTLTKSEADQKTFEKIYDVIEKKDTQDEEVKDIIKSETTKVPKDMKKDKDW